MNIVITSSSVVGSDRTYYGVSLEGTAYFVMALPEDKVNLMRYVGTFIDIIPEDKFNDVDLLIELMNEDTPFCSVKKVRNKYKIVDSRNSDGGDSAINTLEIPDVAQIEYLESHDIDFIDDNNVDQEYTDFIDE